MTARLRLDGNCLRIQWPMGQRLVRHAAWIGGALGWPALGFRLATAAELGEVAGAALALAPPMVALALGGPALAQELRRREVVLKRTGEQFAIGRIPAIAREAFSLSIRKRDRKFRAALHAVSLTAKIPAGRALAEFMILTEMFVAHSDALSFANVVQGFLGLRAQTEWATGGSRDPDPSGDSVSDHRGHSHRSHSAGLVVGPAATLGRPTVHDVGLG